VLAIVVGQLSCYMLTLSLQTKYSNCQADIFYVEKYFSQNLDRLLPSSSTRFRQEHDTVKMSQEVQYRKGKYQPVIAGRNTMIQRSSAPAVYGAAAGSRPSSLRQSLGGGTSFQPGVLSKLSKGSVSDVMDGRTKERKEMQGLNERFASYIEKVRFLEAQNKQLLSDLEGEKKKKCFDVDKIKDMFETELEEARKLIDTLSKEKGEYDAKTVGLQDALETERGL
jgi:hypothetical protein